MGGRGPSSLSLAGKAIWGRALHWAGCPRGGWPTVSQRQEEGEPEFPGAAKASLCNGSRRCRDKPRVTWRVSTGRVGLALRPYSLLHPPHGSSSQVHSSNKYQLRAYYVLGSWRLLFPDSTPVPVRGRRSPEDEASKWHTSATLRTPAPGTSPCSHLAKQPEVWASLLRGAK